MFTALLLIAAVAPPPARPTPDAIARWVAEMGDDSFAAREEASRKLRAAGALAEPALHKALESKDAEIRNRAKAILAEFKWGLFGDTPPAIAELIRAYRAAARNDRMGVVRKLLAAGPAGYRAVVRILGAEEDRALRQEVIGQIAANLPRAVASLSEGGAAPLEELFSLAVTADNRDGLLHYAAYCQLSGQLPARVAEWEAKAAKPGATAATHETLAYLRRAGGDLARAADAAKQAAGLLPLWEALLYESADWKALAARSDLPSFSGEDTWLAYRTAYLRLGGPAKAYQDAIDTVLKRGQAGARPGLNLSHAKALFLNGRADLGLELLRASNYSPKMTFEVLTAQTRVKEALAVVEEARKSASRELATLEILEARTLYHLGEKDKALAALKTATDAVKPGPDQPWHQDLVEAELALDRRDQAFAAAAKVLAATNDPVRAGRLLDKLFDPKGDDALALYKALRRLTPKEPVEKAVERLRGLVAGKGDAKQLVNALKLWDGEVPAEDWRAAGEACAWAKQPKPAAECFRMANTARSWVRLGDLAADAKDWPKAAENYHAAYTLGLKSEPAPPPEAAPCLALWLSGDALAQAGRAAEGKARMERAHLLPLADGEARYEFARALRKRGHKEAVRREEEHLRRFPVPLLAEPNSYYTGEGLRAAAIEAGTRKDWLRAADGYEQTFLRCLQPSMNFTRGSAYVTVPGHIHVTRARGLLAAGRIDEALAEAERARLSQPASVELAMRLVPELDRRDRKKDADALYRQVRDRYAEVAAAYPKCAWARNQMAWLSACCRRDLDDGLAQARRAIELVPDGASYHDTLAEVLFQMGKKDEAAAALKKAVALQPDREEYKKRLKRVEAGDPSAPRVEEDE